MQQNGCTFSFLSFNAIPYNYFIIIPCAFSNRKVTYGEKKNGRKWNMDLWNNKSHFIRFKQIAIAISSFFVSGILLLLLFLSFTFIIYLTHI